MLVSLFFIFILLIQYIDANEPVIVHTRYGDVLGYRTDMAHIFYGIPFAEPPIGPLRWQPPVPISKWSPKIANATQPASSCPQPPFPMKALRITYGMSEDCLYLNIFTPLFNDTSSVNLLPVMLFIHGGGFQWGDASISLYNAEHLVNTSNVIVALIQYRLGVLGFLATGNSSNDLKGNYGILDQRLAIAWIKNNIDAFGGDPNQVTLFGQSAGAQSTTLHYIASDMQSFFQRVIIQSAPLTVPFRTYTGYIVPSVLLAEQLHCKIDDLTCFRTRSADEIIAAQTVVNNLLGPLNILSTLEPWVPVIDNVIVHDNLINSIRNTSFPLKPSIIGTVTDECLNLIYIAWSRNITSVEYAAVLVVLFGEKSFKVLERFPPIGDGDQRPLVVHLCTQWIFSCSTRVLARHAATFTYVFGYPVNTKNLNGSITCRGSACHADELAFVFESNWANFTDVERRVSQSMATYWTNFAKSADPNEPARVPLIWPTMAIRNETYMYIQDPLQIGQAYLKSECDFWDEIGYR